MIDVIIVDDHKLVVESLAKMIDGSGIARVAGKYFDIASCREGLAARARLVGEKECGSDGTVEVMLLDIDLPDGNGVDFCTEIARSYPELRIIMLTGYKEFNIARHSLHNGALGYVLKNADPDEIFAGIEAVARDEQFLCKETGLLLKDKRNTETVWLTGREKEILQSIADGYTAKETADRIFRSVEMVKLYRKKLFLKLGARNAADLIRKGYEMKFLK